MKWYDYVFSAFIWVPLAALAGIAILGAAMSLFNFFQEVGIVMGSLTLLGALWLVVIFLIGASRN